MKLVIQKKKKLKKNRKQSHGTKLEPTTLNRN